MIKARYQKMYTEEHKKDMNFVAIGDRYIGPFVDKNRAEMAVGVIEAYLTPKLDEKPKPTKFVKVEESIFDLRGEFERGELYFSEWGEEKSFAKIKKEHRLMNNLNSGNVYRQVEIDWRNDVNNYFLKTKVLGIDCTIEESIETDFYNDEFISLCHLVASLTEKPTN